jgi:hypothetical protein
MTQSDDNWALAHSIQPTPTREGLSRGASGVVIAAAHPTGWFISARFDPDLTAADVEDFAHFVQVRTYLLLDQGPRPGSWDRCSGGVWRADYRASIGEIVADLPITA